MKTFRNGNFRLDAEEFNYVVLCIFCISTIFETLEMQFRYLEKLDTLGSLISKPMKTKPQFRANYFCC